MKKYSKWLILVAMALILLGQGVAVAEEPPAVNLVLQLNTTDGGIVKGLIAHYLENDYLIKIRDDAKYTVVIINLKESIYQGMFTGSTGYMFVSGVILERITVVHSSGATFEQYSVIGGFADAGKWAMDKHKRVITKKAADIIAVIISAVLVGE